MSSSTSGGDPCDGGSCGTPDYELLVVADAAEAVALAAGLEAAGVPVLASAASAGGPAEGAPAVRLFVSADRAAEARLVLSRCGER